MGKTYTLDPISHKRKVNKGEEDKFYVKDHHEPIISKEDYYRVQEMFSDKQSSNNFRRTPINRAYTFTGKFRCAFCGEPLVKKTSYRNKDVWACRTYVKTGRYLCPNSKVAYEKILKKVFVEGINYLLDKNDFDVDEFMKEITDVLDENKINTAINKTKAQKFELEQKVSKLIDLLLDGKIDNDTFDKKRKSYLDQIEELVTKLDKLSNNTVFKSNDERLIEIKNKILSDLSNEGQSLIKFDNKLFDELVLYGIIGGYDKDDIADPYMIRFVIKPDINSRIKDDMIADMIINNNHIADEDCIYVPILDFRSRQPFYSFELQDNKNTKTYHESVRVRFEIEK